MRKHKDSLFFVYKDTDLKRATIMILNDFFEMPVICGGVIAYSS